MVNHWGSLITKEPLIFDDDSHYILIDENNPFKHINGYYLSEKEFISLNESETLKIINQADQINNDLILEL